MPGNIIQAAPTEVMPARLSRAFHEETHLEADLNLYVDGSSDRQPLASRSRHYFTLSQTLSPADWQSLRAFYYAHQGRAFYFYNLRETVPPFSWDPTGGNTVGRYTVAFDGSWMELYGHERAQMTGAPPVFQGFSATISLGLREIV